MSRRVQRVCELLRREISAILQREFDFGSVLVTVNGVDVTPDLKQAHVYLGMIGPGNRNAEVLERIEGRRAAIQEAIARRVVLKYTPHLHFRADDSIERGVRVLSIMDEIEIPEEEGEGEGAGERSTEE